LVPEGRGEFRLEAGLNAVDSFNSEAAFWQHVRARLQALVSTLLTRLTMVLLAGEKATHPGFLAALRHALEGGLGVNGEGQVLVVDGEGSGGVINSAFAGARGSAQYWRWRQESPIGCEEPKIVGTSGRGIKRPKWSYSHVITTVSRRRHMCYTVRVSALHFRGVFPMEEG
jgi:hypothetical protein